MNNALTTLDTDYVKAEFDRIRELARNGDPSDLAKPLRHLREKILQYPNRIPRDIDNAINGAIFRAQLVATRRVLDPSWDYTDDAEKIVDKIFNLIDAVSDNLIQNPSPTGPALYTAPPPPPQPQRDDETVISVKALTKQFRRSGFKLGPISFDLKFGEILGIVGANGSGKSTLMEMLRGALMPDSPPNSLRYPSLHKGEVDWNLVRPRISYIGQRTPTWHGTVRENLEFAAALHGHKGDENERFVNGILARHELLGYENHTWSQLSSGYRLRFEIALARIPESQLFILDEPLANLDIISQQIFLDDIRQVATAYGVRRAAAIVSSQHIYEIEAIADNVLILNNGIQIEFKKESFYRTYEIWGRTLDHQKLADCLRDLKGGKPLARTSYYLVKAPASVSERELVDALYKHGVEFTYFRDITDSVRVLFEAAQ